MSYRITGLDPAPFQHLFDLPEARLAELGAIRHLTREGDTFPDRITLRDTAPGETVLLLNHEHQPGNTPYRSRHAIFVCEQASSRFDRVGEIAPVLRTRMLSLRAFDAADMMVDADLVDGQQAEHLIERLLAQPAVSYLQAHFARRGCYAARIERA